MTKNGAKCWIATTRQYVYTYLVRRYRIAVTSYSYCTPEYDCSTVYFRPYVLNAPSSVTSYVTLVQYVALDSTVAGSTKTASPTITTVPVRSS